MKKSTIIIAGSGYSGINAYYELKNHYNVILINNNNYFNYYSKNGTEKIYVKNIKNEIIKDIDISHLNVKTDKSNYYCDRLILSLGCDRDNQINFLKNMEKYDNLTLSSENKYDDYILIQYILYLKSRGKNFYYSGDFLSFLGENISNEIRNFMELSGIKYKEKSDNELPECKPNFFGDFLDVNENFIYKKNVFAIGDLIKSDIKLGELSMRQGIYAGKYIKNNNIGFNPIFITSFTNYHGLSIRIKSKIPWNNSYQYVKISHYHNLMTKNLGKYYKIRSGKMGFIRYF